MIGRPFCFVLTGGNAADSRVAPQLLAGLKNAICLLGDKGYDADSLLKKLRQCGISPVFPGKSNRKRRVRYDKRRYRDRHFVDNAFCRLKDSRQQTH